ncbi:MAG: EFR1 family ferrodoxin [Eubacteriales bacterium]
MSAIKIGLFTFSGTGNTARIADMLSDAFIKHGAEVTQYNIEKIVSSEPLPDLSAFDYIGLGYPIHAFNEPPIVTQFIKALPKSIGQKTFIFKSAGEPFFANHVSSQRMIHLLTKKDYTHVFERHFLMPYNIMFRYPDGLVKQMVITAEKLAHHMAGAILAGQTHIQTFNIFARINGIVMRFFKNYGVALNGKFFFINKKCTHCMRCVRECPVGNITYDGKRFHFGWRCMLCMRCAMRCPADAVKMSVLTPWVLYGEYDFKRIMTDPEIDGDFVNDKTRGYFRLFRKYFKWAEREID